MSDSIFPKRLSLRQDWIRRHRRTVTPEQARLRAGRVEGVLPRRRLEVPHLSQSQLSRSVPCCVAMVMDYFGRAADVDWLAELLRTDERYGTPGRRLEQLRYWGVRVEFPDQLQFFRDGTLELNERVAGRLPNPFARLVFQWERPWLRWIETALSEEIPPILFVDLGRLYPRWRGLSQPHAVVLAGGEGRWAWVHDPAQPEGPARVPVSRLLDSLLPFEPLAALVSPAAELATAEADRGGEPR